MASEFGKAESQWKSAGWTTPQKVVIEPPLGEDEKLAQIMQLYAVGIVSNEFLSSSFGLPKKRVNVDKDTQPSKVSQTGGMLYEAEKHTKVVGAAPALRCPCCGSLAANIAGASDIYQIRIKESGGKSHMGSVPPCPLSGVEHPGMQYTIDPCGCRVSQHWAGEFQRELLSRLDGKPPKAIQDLTTHQRAGRLKVLENRLSALYALQAQQNTPQMVEAIDYWIVIVADQMQRLCPSPLNAAPKKLSNAVAAWADAGCLAVPPTETPSVNSKGWPQPSQTVDWKVELLPQAPMAEGMRVYRMQDGSVSPTPAFEGQIPCGIVQAPSPKMDPTPEIPDIRRTKMGQYGVRYKDKYEVFQTWGEADARAKSMMLADLAPKAKPELKETTPAPYAAKPAAPAPEPVVDKTVKKRRTIRKIDE